MLFNSCHFYKMRQLNDLSLIPVCSVKHSAHDSLLHVVPSPPKPILQPQRGGGGNDWCNRFHPACGTSIDSWHTSRQM